MGKNTPTAKVCLNKTAPCECILLDQVPSKKYDLYGYGLSYANLSYTNARLSEYTAKIGEKVKCEIDVSNPSDFAISEIVQLYYTKKDKYEPQFVDLKTIEITPKSKSTAVFEVDTQSLDYSSEENIPTSKFYICFGKSSEDVVKILFTVIF